MAKRHGIRSRVESTDYCVIAMKLHIDRPHIEPMIATFPRLAFVQEQLRFGNRVELAFGQMDAEELDFLQDLYAQGG